MLRSILTAAADRWVSDPDFGGRAVRVLEYDRPAAASDRASTAQSIALMHRLTNRDATSPEVRAAVLKATTGLSAHPTARQIADAVFRFCQSTVSYQHEDTMQTPFSDFADFLYDQTLITPAALLQMPRPAGDCVDFSALCAAMLQACDIPAAFKTIAADPASLDYSHVYVICQLAPGSFYVLDTSNGPGPGYEYKLPAGRKARVWPNPQDLIKRRRKPAPMIHNRPYRLGDLVEGDGDIPDTPAGNWNPYSNEPNPGYTGTQLSTSPPGSSNWNPYSNAPNPGYTGTQLSTSPPGSSAGGSSPWTKIATTIINDASAIAAPLIRQSNIQAPYYIAGANGAQILYDPSTGKTANAGAASQRTPAIISQNLLIGAGVAAALLVALTMSKR